jgi:transposase InsO family protein
LGALSSETLDKWVFNPFFCVLAPLTRNIANIPSLGKYVYYVSFIDDFSRNTWIYFLRKKSEVFDRFKEFKALVENQIEKIIKVLRTDNGGEFCGNEFEEFCKKCGIERKKTTPYTPQQNGVAERMNMTLMEKSRCMLSGVGLGQEFWAEAVGTACYLVNRSPSSTLDDKTPHEVWTGKKPSLTHLRYLVVMPMFTFQRKT